jgi:hypothetical protein
MVDEEDIPILDSWTERKVEDLSVLGDDMGHSVPIELELEFSQWHQEALINDDGNE